VGLEADLSDPATPARLFDLAERELGPVDVLVNNASGWIADTFTDRKHHDTGPAMTRVSAATHDRQFAVDARGGALMIAEFARRHMERRGTWGRIIGLTSGGPLGFPGEVSYGAAKAALENYTMSAAWELAEFGVTANIVYPPVTDTGWVTDEVRAHVQRRPDLLHIVEPTEIAAAIAFLCSDHARLVTANILHLR
jgi:3-oxoacyl-[acyl-carrier protein] reductase